MSDLFRSIPHGWQCIVHVSGTPGPFSASALVFEDADSREDDDWQRAETPEEAIRMASNKAGLTDGVQ